jgi:hypothetical protein
MAVWTNFAALVASLASGKAFTDEKAQALAENVKAAFEGDATAVADGVTLRDAALDTGAATAAGTTWVALRNAGVSAGAVGSYAFLFHNTVNTTLSLGSTYAGSALVYGGVTTDPDVKITASSPSGTWRAMGIAPNSISFKSGTICLRIA